MKEKTNLPESVYKRLKNISIAQTRPMQEVLRYYAMERFLYRLSISSYKNLFFLKGGLLFMVWNPHIYRATIDIDFLAKIKNSADNILKTIKEICFIKSEPDGIEFNISDIKISENQLEAKYQGLSVKFYAHLFTAKILLKIDIGFNDAIHPKPANILYPSLLGLSPPHLKGYTPETSIAEKMHAITMLGHANTRMKDFYDIWVMIHTFKINLGDLEPILKSVFEKRKTVRLQNPEAFSEKFYTNSKVIERWEAFLKGINQKNIPLEQLIQELKNFFSPIFNKQLKKKRKLSAL